MKLKYISLAVLAASSVSAHAAGLNLGNYSLSGSYALSTDVGSVSGLEASAVTYARDRGTLFFVGDEGSGIIEISKTGQTLGAMNFDWNGTGSSKQDTESLAYLGNGQIAVGEERLYDIYSFAYASGGTAVLANSRVSISNATVGNNGLEGMTYDARNGGSFVTVKQSNPQDILGGTLTFGNGSGVANMSQLFDPALLGVNSLSDVAALSAVDSFVGTTYADNLLLLSLDSNLLLEVTRTGQILGSLDLSGISVHNAIEGVTVDENGTIYLVAEQAQDGFADPHSYLYILSAPVPEPETYAMFLAGLGILGAVTRHKKSGS